MCPPPAAAPVPHLSTGMASPALTAPSLRNRGPILAFLQSLPLPAAHAHALEVGAGLGAHLAVNSAAFPALTWHPTELDVAGGDAHLVCAPNVRALAALDAAARFADWPPAVRAAAGGFALVLCVNVLHVAPWEVARGLFRGAAQACGNGGLVVVYGPFLEDGVEVAAETLRFDDVLKARDERWGVRRLTDVQRIAADEGFQLTVRSTMAVTLFLCLGFSKVESRKLPSTSLQ